MKNTTVEYPGIRSDIIAEVKILSDKQRHLNDWTKRESRFCFWSNFVLYTDILVDGMPCHAM